jgi:AraC-like DNA-binding protein
VLISCEPAPHLSPYVRRYYGFREETGARTRRREGPGAEVVIVLSFGPHWRIGDAVRRERPLERLSSFAGGLRMTSVLTEHEGLSHGAQVSLTPPGAYALFGVPMHALAGGTVPLSCLLGVDADRLVERLATMRAWPERFAALERALARRLDRGAPTPGVVWAWRRLAAAQGRVPVRELQSELGWSAKRLVRRFREEIGLTPKAVSRLLRFERAAALLERADRPSLAAVAVDCGYYDQAHLTNEFRRITGVTPSLYSRRPVFSKTAAHRPA